MYTCNQYVFEFLQAIFMKDSNSLGFYCYVNYCSTVRSEGERWMQEIMKLLKFIIFQVTKLLHTGVITVLLFGIV